MLKKKQVFFKFLEIMQINNHKWIDLKFLGIICINDQTQDNPKGVRGVSTPLVVKKIDKNKYLSLMTFFCHVEYFFFDKIFFI